VPASGSVRRRQAGVLVIGAVEPEVQSWLHAAGHTTRTARTAAAALQALDEAPADLVIADGGRRRRESAAVAHTLRADPRLGNAWLIAITPRAAEPAAAEAGADDHLARPFTRAQLLARVAVGLRAVQERSDSALLRSLMASVPGAIYRSAWHAEHRLELITDEIERISGYPAASFIASARRTLLSVIHPDDRERVLAAVADEVDETQPFVLEYRIVRADGAVRWVLDRGQLVPGPGGRRWMDGAIFDITERREAEQALRRQEIEAARTAELRASRARIVEAADAARRRIERDLHDGAQQRLVALALDVRLARSTAERDPAAVAPALEKIGAELAEATAELRELARGIHPALLTERGLAPAVSALAARAPVPVELLELPQDRLPPVAEATAYFTVSEALTNVAKYARATHASVRLAREDGKLVVEVRDDGIGGASVGAGSGLSGLSDRVGACDGSLSVSSPPGEGTLVRAVLPVQTTSS
jgi:PAS domain S-box-containing protein